MSMIDDVKDALLEEVAKLLVRLPIEAVKLLLDLVRGAVASDDPARFIKRKAMADASELATKKVIEQALEASSELKSGG